MDNSVLLRLKNAANRIEKAVDEIEEIVKIKGKVECLDANGNIEGRNEIAAENLKEFDEHLNILPSWLQISDKIGGDVAEIGKKVNCAFSELRNFLKIAAGRKEPTDQELQTLITPVFERIREVVDFKEEKRNSPFANHLAAVEEAINGLAWISVKKTPASFIKDMLDASTFYLNRILMQYKNVDSTHEQWVTKWKEVWNKMHSYIVKYHRAGLEWNTNPTEPSTRALPPPPPPPLPPNLFENIAKSNTKSIRDSLFAEINKGSEITAKLKKITDDMKTHKNPELRKNNMVSKPSENLGKKEQNEKRIYLQNAQQWNIDHVIGESNIEIDITDKKQTIYIYKCRDAVIRINGKANAITIDSCHKTSVVFDGLIGQSEIINSQSIQIQTLGELPTVSIQKTDGCQVYLSKIAHNAQIISSKSSGMNILAQLNDTDDEYTEMAIPEQYVTIINGKKLETSVSEIV